MSHALHQRSVDETVHSSEGVRLVEGACFLCPLYNMPTSHTMPGVRDHPRERPAVSSHTPSASCPRKRAIRASACAGDLLQTSPNFASVSCYIAQVGVRTQLFCWEFVVTRFGFSRR